MIMVGVRFPDATAAHRKALICWLGQPVRIRVEVLPGWDGLVAHTLRPLEGFIHLVADPEACVREYGPYHLSICQRALVSDSEMEELRRAWDGLEITLPVSHVSGEGCMELGSCPLTEDVLIRELHHHQDAWYRDRPFHISG